MIYKLSVLFMYFITYSFIGYVIEVISTSIHDKKLNLSRGFLIGPVIPIFGFGGLAIVTLLNRYSNEIITLFVMATVICCVLEYFTSYLMEKIFKMRWWNYSYKKYNINGRISLDFAIYFGIGGVLTLKFFHPLLSKFILSINHNTLIALAIILFILIWIDTIISTNIIFKFKDNVNKYINKDSTMRIKAEVRRVLKERSVLTVRLLKAFPNINIFSRERRISKIKKLILKRKEYKELKKKKGFK